MAHSRIWIFDKNVQHTMSMYTNWGAKKEWKLDWEMEIYVEKTNAMKVKHNKLFQYRPEMNLHGFKRNLQLGTYFLKRHTIRVFFYNEFIVFNFCQYKMKTRLWKLTWAGMLMVWLNGCGVAVGVPAGVPPVP